MNAYSMFTVPELQGALKRAEDTVAALRAELAQRHSLPEPEREQRDLAVKSKRKHVQADIAQVWKWEVGETFTNPDIWEALKKAGVKWAQARDSRNDDVAFWIARKRRRGVIVTVQPNDPVTKEPARYKLVKPLDD